MLRKVSRLGLWISTVIMLLLAAAQSWSGGWTVFYLVWPGFKASSSFIMLVANLSVYHIRMGFAIGIFSILIIIFAFLSRSSLYVRILSIVGLGLTALAAYGGYLFVTSTFQDRLSLGQMADSFIGVFAAYFLQLFFMNKTPAFPWSRTKSR